MPMLRVSSGFQMHYIIPSSDPTAPSIDPTRPTVVLLHPLFFDSYFFAPQHRDSRLAKGYNLVAIDHHYHGQTKVQDDKPYNWKKVAGDILSAMDALGIKEAHVLGNSHGAQIATVMAIKAPKRIQSLTLIAQNPPVESAENLEQFTFLRDACYATADDGSDRLASDVVNGLYWIYFDNDPSAQAVIDEWVASSKFRPSNPKLIARVFSVMLERKPIETPAWDSITCPILIIHGSNDVLSPPSVAREFFHNLRNAQREIHIIEGAPHFLSHTHYIAVNKYVADFLDRVTGIDSRAAALAPRKFSTSSINLKEQRGTLFRRVGSV